MNTSPEQDFIARDPEAAWAAVLALGLTAEITEERWLAAWADTVAPRVASGDLAGAAAAASVLGYWYRRNHALITMPAHRLMGRELAEFIIKEIYGEETLAEVIGR